MRQNHKNKKGEVTSVLAFDDITGMKLDAGKVVEAKTKEIHYVRDMRVYDKIPRAQAARKGWRSAGCFWKAQELTRVKRMMFVAFVQNAALSGLTCMVLESRLRAACCRVEPMLTFWHALSYLV